MTKLRNIFKSFLIFLQLIVTVDGFSQFVNIGIDFDLYGDGRLYFGASNSDNRNYLNGEMRAVSYRFLDGFYILFKCYNS